VEPVVERADAGEEEDRTDHHRPYDEDDLRVPDGIPAPPGAQHEDEEHPEHEPESGHPGAAHEAGPEEESPRRAVRRLEVRRVLLGVGLVVCRRHARFSLIHLSNSACVTTRALARIVACPSPHSSAHMTANSPVRVGVTMIVVWMPGTASIF